MLLSCLFYWALSWYVEKVSPGEFGIPLAWNFLFKREYWRSTPRVQGYENPLGAGSKTATALSRTNSNGSPIVRVEHLVKQFGPDKIAVNDVSFDLYENQITSLLGPNGSGKTTIFNCLIGIYKQTSGPHHHGKTSRASITTHEIASKSSESPLVIVPSTTFSSIS